MRIHTIDKLLKPLTRWILFIIPNIYHARYIYNAITTEKNRELFDTELIIQGNIVSDDSTIISIHVKILHDRIIVIRQY